MFSTPNMMKTTSGLMIDPCAYTSGRWLRQDKVERDSRYIKFNFEALCQRIIDLCPGADTIVTCQKIEGGFNRVFIFTLDNAKQIVAKLPFPLAGPTKLTTASEVATVHYLQARTSIPIPTILDWHDDAAHEDNLIGSEYIIMEHASGVPLREKWQEMTGDQQMKISVLDRTAVVDTGTAIQENIGITTERSQIMGLVGWYASAFFLTIASFQSTWGKGYKYFPLKTTFLGAISTFEIGSLICAVAQNSTTLIVGRAVAGMGAAGIASGAYTIIAFLAPPRQRPAFTGLLGATYGLASVIGPLLGGVFTDKVSWRWCFYINLPIGGLSAVIVLFLFRAPPAAQPAKASWREKFLQMDLLGTFTIMAAVVCYLLALQWAGVTKAWSSADVIGTIVGFLVIVVLFVVIELWMGERALFQPRLLKQRNIWANNLYVFFLAGAMYTLIYYLPIYFQSIKSASAAQSGIRNLPLILAISLLTIFSGGLITATGHFGSLMVIGSALATVGSGLICTLDIDTGSGKWIGYQIVAGVGLGLALQIPVILNQALVTPSDLSSISAVTLFMQTLGRPICVSAAQAAFVNRLVTRLSVLAPNVDAKLVVATGASELRHTFNDEDIGGILEAYMDGLKLSFLLCTVLAGVTLVISALPKWVNLKGKVQGSGAT
ncbi:hypothetical protein KXW39_006112 [Aspergillus fumigatus]|nr:hypothetical protein KXX29_003517 [Aspergillus fumigatus]KAH1747179.1 hypothetical protein KXX56_003074 [Aspergillus fumigatus]KAH1913551.1 hypothetical protein KXW69_007071 [Aspergillus fumigatus]KAH1925173.1 hypothetical protein KXV48_004189 [Aspergillus fumigatus]KAH2080368.1 hypothetical protein KXX03_004652 [Aspergillus fumigatus]